MSIGGMHGPMSTAGGVMRTYGLHRHFTRPALDGQPVSITRAGLRRIARYFRPYWLTWLVILGCIVAVAYLNVQPPLLVKRIIDRAIPANDVGTLWMLVAAMVGVAIAAGLVGVLEQSLTAKAGHGIIFDMKNQLYRHLQRMGLHFYTSVRSGEIVSRINNDVSAVQGVATGTLVSIANNLITLAVTSSMLFRMNWRLALLALLVVPAFYLPSRIVGSIARRLSTQAQETRAGILAFLSERLQVGGSILTGIFGQRQADAEVFTEKSARLRDLSVRQAVVGRWLRMILTIFVAIGPAAIYLYGGYQAIHHGLTIGELVAFAALLTLLYRPLVQLASVYVDIQAGFAVFERVFEYLDLVPDIQDRPGALPVTRTAGHVVFQDVCFAYPSAPAVTAAVGDNGDSPAAPPSADPFALREVSLEIRPGEQVALVGPTGAGKTTITYLLPRFYDPSAGRITLDGRDLRDLAQEDLRRHIGMVTQVTFLFHASVRENLLYARPDAGEDQIIAACRAANIHEFIAALPEGYDTIVGEQGFRLSGGEKQRLSIARALLKDPAILILDEATSSLDAATEYLIQTALEKLLRGRTSLIIAHRLSTILSSDRIVVLDAGRVVETGRHEELVARGGLYAELFEQQFGKVLSGATLPRERP